MDSSSRNERWFWRASWLAVLLVFYALAWWALPPLSAWAKQTQARNELTAMQRMLTEFHARHQGWPQVHTPERFIAALRGRANAKGVLTNQQPSFLFGAQLYFKDGKFEGPGAAIIDPWGTPYIYVYVYPFLEQPESYLLVSAGPDRRHSLAATWFPGQNGFAPQDADNLWIRPGEPVQTGVGKSLAELNAELKQP